MRPTCPRRSPGGPRRLPGGDEVVVPPSHLDEPRQPAVRDGPKLVELLDDLRPILDAVHGNLVRALRLGDHVTDVLPVAIR